MISKHPLPALIACVAVLVGSMVHDSRKVKREEAKAAERAEAWEKYVASLNKTIDTLDKQIETAKFWTIVTQDD